MAISSREKTQAVRHGLRFTTVDGITAMPLVFLMLPGNFIIAALLAKTLQLPSDTYGLIVSLPFWGNFLQILITPLLTRHFSSRGIVLVTGWLHLATWLVLAVALSWLSGHDPESIGRWFFVFYLISSLFMSLNGVTWTAWIREWVPPGLRGKYFGARNRLLQLSTLAFLLVVGEVLDRHDSSLRAFQWIFLAAVAFRAVSLLAIAKVRAGEAVRHEREAGEGGFRGHYRAIAASRSLLTFIAFGALWGFAANCFGPFYPVFMFNDLGLSTLDVGIFQALGLAGGALSLPAWGQLLDRFGNKPVMTISFILWQVSNFLWCILHPGNTHLLYFMWTWAGITSAGFVLGQFNILLKIIPATSRTTAIGLNLAVTSLVTALAPIFGGRALAWALARGHDSLDAYHVAFLVQPVLGLVSCLLLLRVIEPKAQPLGYVVGAMRNIRTLGAVFGLGFLLNHVFYRTPKR